MDQSLDVYFDPAYAALYERPGTKSKVFDFRCSEGSVHYVFLERDIPETDGLHDITTPYGYGGPLIVGQPGDPGALAHQFDEAFGEYCEQESIVSEFVRFHPLAEGQEAMHDLYVAERRSLNVAVDLRPEMDVLWMSFDHKVRKNVKRAQTNGLTCGVDLSGARITDFLEIYYGTMDRRSAGKEYYFSKEYFRRLSERLPRSYAFFFVEDSGTPISAELVLLGAEGTMHSFLGGTRSESFALRPNDFLKYSAISWGREHSYHTFLLGGGKDPDDGIFRYKRGFSPTGVVDFKIGKRVRDEPIYARLVEGVRQKGVDAGAFFPQYRAT